MSSGSSAARLGETLARMDVRPRIHHRQIAGVVVVDRDLEKRLLALRHLAAAVGRERPEQPRHQVRTPLRHLVVDRHRAGQRRQPARFRGLQAQQPDDVAGIGVEMLPLGGLVGAHVRVRCRAGPDRGHGPAGAPWRSATARCRNTCRCPNRRPRCRRSACPRPAGRGSARSRARSRISSRIASSRAPSVGSGKSARLISAMSRPRSRTRAVALSISAISAAERE